MGDLAEFLLARFAEDPRVDAVWREALRQIVKRYIDNSPSAPNAYDLALLDVMRDLTAVYADHPDCQPEWRS